MGRVWTALVVFLWSLGSQAATFSVTSTADSGPGSLRQAITQANATAGNHTINIPVTGAIELLSALPELRANVAIVGPGRDELAVRRGTGATTAFRIYTVATNRNVTVRGMTMANGNGAIGGAVLNGGRLNLADVSLVGNYATNPFGDGGGGILNYGVLNVTNSLILTNRSDNWGGGLRNIQGSFVLHETLVAGNVGGGGAGVANNGGTGVVSRSTISGNYGFHGGAGIITYFGLTIVTNSTISSNFTQSSVGGAGLLTTYGQLSVSYSTIYGNQAPYSGRGGGVRNEVSGNSFIESSIVASND